jgi:anti-sigma B factor antagonist
LITIAGEIDIATVPALRRHLLALPPCSTVLELSGVQLLSAAGLTELVNLRDRLTNADARLALAAAPPSVRRILAITGLDDTMTLTDTLQDAVDLVAAPIPLPPGPLRRYQRPDRVILGKAAFASVAGRVANHPPCDRRPRS